MSIKALNKHDALTKHRSFKN